MRARAALVTAAIAATTIAGVVLIVGVFNGITIKCGLTTAPNTVSVAPL